MFDKRVSLTTGCRQMSINKKHSNCAAEEVLTSSLFVQDSIQSKVFGASLSRQTDNTGRFLQ